MAHRWSPRWRPLRQAHRLIRVLATVIGIIRLTVFELFRLMGVTVATMWLLASGLMSVMIHKHFGSRAVTHVACSLCHRILSLLNCIRIVFSFFPDKSVPVCPSRRIRCSFGGVRTHVTSVPFFGDVHSTCVSTGVPIRILVPLGDCLQYKSRIVV
jgi:hypothetical protein